MIHKNWLRKSLIITALLLLPIYAQAQKPAPKPPPVLVSVTSYPAAQIKADVAAYYAAFGANDMKLADQIEDKIVWRIVTGEDLNHFNWKQGIVSGSSRKNFILDIVENGALAAIGLFNPVGTKNGLAAALEFIRGGRASYAKEYLNGSTLLAVLNFMEAGRADQRTVIEDGLAEGPERYPLDRAIADTAIYFYKGSLTSGIEEMVQSAGAVKSAAQARQVAARAQRAVKQ